MSSADVICRRRNEILAGAVELLAAEQVNKVRSKATG